MTKNKNFFIIIGAILIIAHLASLALAFNNSRKKNSSTDPSTPWTDKLGEWASFLAPRIDVTHLLCEGTNIKPRNGIALNNNLLDCIINLTPGMKGDEKFWKIDVKRKWSNNLPKAYVLSKIPLKDSNGNKIELPKKCLKSAYLDEQKKPKGDFWLKLELVESGFESNSSDRICWTLPDDSLKAPFVVIPNDGGTGEAILTLSCVGCDNNSNRILEVWLE